MAATYGYGGEFSSDEDIDRTEHQSERIVQSKFDSHAQIKPNKNQIEEAIETIKRLPLDQDFNLTDELLAGLLDYYKTQRGPIVDSTRNLYKKIILRIVRGEQQQQQASNGDTVTVAENVTVADNINAINNNNNNIIGNHLVPKHLKPQQAPYELGSSDEDEPMLPASQSSVLSRKVDSRVINNDKIEPMEVDSETPSSQILRANQPRKVSDELSSSESSTDESSDESDSDSEVLDLTPVKNQAASNNCCRMPVSAKAATKVVPASRERKIAPATQTSSVLATKSNTEEIKKPYTRSQRVVATRSTSKQQSLDEEKKANVSSSKHFEASPGVKPSSKSVLQNLISQNQPIEYSRER